MGQLWAEFPSSDNFSVRMWHLVPDKQHSGCRTKQECVYLLGCSSEYAILGLGSEWRYCTERKKIKSKKMFSIFSDMCKFFKQSYYGWRTFVLSTVTPNNE